MVYRLNLHNPIVQDVGHRANGLWLILAVVAGLLPGIPLAWGQSVTVAGNVQLENSADHSGVEVIFNKVAPAPLGQSSVFSGSTGAFNCTLGPGIYEITFKKPSYFSVFLGQINCFVDTNLPLQTLSVRQTLIQVPLHFAKIQHAINDAVNGDTVLLQPMTYQENIRLNGKAILLTSNFLFTHNQEDIDKTVIDGGGIKSVIVCDFFEGQQTVLSGFTIQNGNATGGYPDYFGGGVRCINTSPTLQHLVIKNNHADYGGGGVYMIHSNSKLSHLLILDNSVARDGGGVRVTSSTPTISNCVIARNTAETGGGITCNYFTGDVVTTTIVNSTIAYNHVTLTSSNDFNGGAGIKLTGANLSMTNSLVAHNTGDYGISYFSQGIASYPLISYSGFYGNGNNFYQCNPLNGPIVTQNINGDPVDAFFNVFGEIPFADPDYYDFGLVAGADAIDAGENSFVSVAEDFGLKPRIQNNNGLPSARVNMGAIESLSAAPPTITSVAPICVGEGVEVTITSPGSQFSWYKSMDDPNVIAQTYGPVMIDTLTSTTEFFISNTSYDKPSRRVPLQIVVHEQPDFAIEAVPESPTSYKFSASPTGGIESYEWHVEGTSLTSSEESPVFDFTSSGLYGVCLKASNPGCEIEECEDVNLVITGDPVHATGSTILVYPNPAKDNLNITAPGHNVLYVEILNTLGQVVLYTRLEGNKTSLEYLLPGVYLVRIQTASNQTRTFRVVKTGNN